MQTDLRSTCQYTMIPGPPYRWCHSVMKFADHDPNLRESDAHEVPGPHNSTSRASSVLFTTVRIAARRLSRLMKNRRVRRSATSVSASAPGIAVVPSATRLIPTLVPNPYSHSTSRRRSCSPSGDRRQAVAVPVLLELPWNVEVGVAPDVAAPPPDPPAADRLAQRHQPAPLIRDPHAPAGAPLAHRVPPVVGHHVVQRHGVGHVIEL